MSDPSVYIVGLNDMATATAIRLYRAGIKVACVAPNGQPDIFSHRNFSAVPVLGRRERYGVVCRTCADYVYHTDDAPGETYAIMRRILAERHIPCLSIGEWQEMHFEYPPWLFVLENPDGLTTHNGVSYALRGVDFPLARLYVCRNGEVAYPFTDLEEWNRDEETEGILKTSGEGIVQTIKKPGEAVRCGEPVLRINKHNICAQMDGVLEGVLPSGSFVSNGQPVARILEKGRCPVYKLPVASQAVAGAFLELYLYLKKV
ncbi:MAG: hypothetical protein D6677_06135 [Calditrichaeota bacterium]|nr:MAG: hypothetical protein D6677_06135 [Calditrichota bacterium]